MYSLDVIFEPNWSSVGCLGAYLESVMYARQMPAENRANSGSARLVLEPGVQQ